MSASDINISNEKMSELFCVSETIENGNMLVVASPEIWVKGHILLWPPGPVAPDRSQPVIPGPDWIPQMCKVLKGSIATFEEALELEQRYSKHRDSNSFHEAQARKLLKRLHPVNENEKINKNLIDLNSLVKKIDQGRADPKKKVVTSEVEDGSSKSNKYHIHCLNNNKPQMQSGKSTNTHSAVEKPKPRFYKRSKDFNSENSNSKSVNVVKEHKKPRYENYLKSGRIIQKLEMKNYPLNIRIGDGNKNAKNITKTRYEERPTKQKGRNDDNKNASTTITKEQFLIQNGISESEFRSTVGDTSTPNVKEKIDELPEIGNDFIGDINSQNFVGCTEVNTDDIENPKNLQQKSVTRNTPAVAVIEDVVIKPALATPLMAFGFDQFGVDTRSNQFDTTTQSNRIGTVARSNQLGATSGSNQFGTASGYDQFSSASGPNQFGTAARSNQFGSASGSNQFGSNFENNVLSSLQEITNLYKISEEKRLRFEARMQTQWEIFVKKTMKMQSRNNESAESDGETEDFDDLDKNFPIENESVVEDLDWNIKKDLPFKRHLRDRLKQLGGNNPKKSIRLIMKYLFTDKCLDHFTWRGTAELAAFEKLVFLNQLIYSIVSSHFKKYTLQEYQLYMVQWIKHSTTRQRTVVYHYANRNQQHENDEDFDED